MMTAEDIVRDKGMKIISIPGDKTILEAIRIMVQNKIGAILVEKEGQFVGIWTDRNLLHDTLQPDFDPQTARIADHMTEPLPVVAHNTPIHMLEDNFLGLFVRQLLVEKDGRYIGLISLGDMLRANLLEKERNFKELNSLVSWEYYENWKWEPPEKK